MISSIQLKPKGMLLMYGYVVANKGYYEVYSFDGELICTADTKTEAMEDLENWEEKIMR